MIVARMTDGGAVVVQWWRSIGAVVEQQWWSSSGAVVVQWWHSGERTRVPPMLPGFMLRSRRRCHIWVEFVGGRSLTLRGVSPSTPVFLSL